MVRRCPSAGPPGSTIAGRPWMLGEAARTVPSAATTWATPSSFTLRSTDGRSPVAAWSRRSRAREWERSSLLDVRFRSTVLTTRAPAAARRTAQSSRASTVARARTVSQVISGIAHQPVAGQPHRLQAGPPEGEVDPLTQLSCVHLDDVRVALEGEVPHVVEDPRLGHHLAG